MIVLDGYTTTLRQVDPCGAREHSIRIMQDMVFTQDKSFEVEDKNDVV